jgi:hypothetical protein
MATPGRNDPCPCGSGKKYKHCCLRKDEDAARKARSDAAEKLAAEKPAEEQAAAVPAEGSTDKPAADTQDQAHAKVARPTKHATTQPWKRNAVPGAQKFNIPRRSGGS